ncbi:MAG: Outer rane lipoproteinsorting protein [Candidatus Binatota bacterium]|nr:Outer rane lipoproteinsorting protein [Candidatus Binatota bacterium]
MKRRLTSTGRCSMESAMNRAAAILVLACLAAHPRGARAERSALAAMVDDAEEQARLLTPLRADVTAEIEGAKGKSQDRIVLVVRNDPAPKGGVQTYVEFEKAGVKVLVLGPAEAWISDGGKVRKAALDTQIAGTNWTVEDLLPFDVTRCGSTRIVDSRPEQMTLACEAERKGPSQYVLTVYKMDREKAVPIQVLYYKESMNNLVKMQRAQGYEKVGAKWRPSHVEMRDFKLRTKDVLDLRWEQDPKFPPEIFDPKSLSDRSLTAKAPAAAAR